MEILSPVNLNLDQFLVSHPPGAEFSTVRLTDLKYIVDILCRLPIERPENVTDDGFVPLSAKILNSRMNDYKANLDYLLSTGVIECDNTYTAANIAKRKSDVKSYGYRFTHQFQQEMRAAEVNEKWLMRLRKRDNSLSQSHKVEYRHLLKWFDDKLEIDLSAAIEDNQCRYDQIKNDKSKWENKIEKHSIYGEVASVNLKNPQISYLRVKSAIERFARKDYFFALSRARRLTTSLNCLNKESRKFLSYDGDALVGLDVSSCQPFLIQILADSRFWTNQHDHFNVRDLRQHQITSRYIRELRSSSGSCLPMLGKMDEILAGEGFQRFIACVSSPNFYKHFLESHEFSNGSDCLFDNLIYDVKDLKIGFLKYLNASYKFSSAVKAGVKKDFPELDLILRTLKRIDKGREFSTFLQAIEATMMLLKICKRISKEHPQVPIFSVHDSILTTRGNADLVNVLMKEEFTKCFGVSPHIKYE